MPADAVAEIVTFRLVPGTDPATFRRLAGDGVARFLAGRGALARTLSLGPDGRWTDHVIWPSRTAAEAAAAEIATAPDCAAFLPLIDGASVAIRHETVAATGP